MRLDHATWYEVEAYLHNNRGIILPVGSTEQHGPIGLIGTDAICAELIARKAGEITRTYVAPTLTYTPAPFNMHFPGTMSLSAAVFQAMATELLAGLHAQGFARIYIVNGHGANLEPLKAAMKDLPQDSVRLRSWWDFDAVNTLRKGFYGDWEGMHATPSEVAITQAELRVISHPDANSALKKLTPEFISAHAGDKHGPAAVHKADFPDGRVGSHSALATPDHGRQLLDAAVHAVSADFKSFAETP